MFPTRINLWERSIIRYKYICIVTLTLSFEGKRSISLEKLCVCIGERLRNLSYVSSPYSWIHSFVHLHCESDLNLLLFLFLLYTSKFRKVANYTCASLAAVARGYSPAYNRIILCIFLFSLFRAVLFLFLQLTIVRVTF